MFAVKEGKTSRVVVSLYTSLSTPRLLLSHVVCFVSRSGSWREKTEKRHGENDLRRTAAAWVLLKVHLVVLEPPRHGTWVCPRGQGLREIVARRRYARSAFIFLKKGTPPLVAVGQEKRTKADTFFFWPFLHKSREQEKRPWTAEG